MKLASPSFIDILFIIRSMNVTVILLSSGLLKSLDLASLPQEKSFPHSSLDTLLGSSPRICDHWRNFTVLTLLYFCLEKNGQSPLFVQIFEVFFQQTLVSLTFSPSIIRHQVAFGAGLSTSHSCMKVLHILLSTGEFS